MLEKQALKKSLILRGMAGIPAKYSIRESRKPGIIAYFSGFEDGQGWYRKK